MSPDTGLSLAALIGSVVAGGVVGVCIVLVTIGFCLEYWRAAGFLLVDPEAQVGESIEFDKAALAPSARDVVHTTLNTGPL
jgi:hypothetical protein